MQRADAQEISPENLRILRRTGTVLIAVGIVDICYMVYCVANRISYSSSLNVFAVIAGIFLRQGSLRAAAVVRAFAVLLLAGCLALAVAWPFLQPWDLTLTEARLNPWSTAISYGIALVILPLLFWVQRSLGQSSVIAATPPMRRSILDVRISAAAGAFIVLLLVIGIPMLTRGEYGQKAVSQAEAQLGSGFRYHVASMQIQYNGQQTEVSADVTAWNRQEIRSVPVHWRE